MVAATVQQMAIDFAPATVNNPANGVKLRGQNQRLYEYLADGNTIHVFSQAMRQLGIGYLNSRISDLRNKCHLVIYSRDIVVNNTHCNEYSLKPF